MKLITTYFPELTKSKIKIFNNMKTIYSNWNNKINLVSKKSFDYFYTNHVLHSLSIAKFISFNNNTTIADIGTGGGFPGIPLAIFFDTCDFTLIDSKKKKIKTLIKISKKLKIKNIQFSDKRIEKIKKKFDFIIGRAVNKDVFMLYNSIKKNLKLQSTNNIKNGFIYLKGDDINNYYPYNINITKTYICKYFNIKSFKDKIILYIPI
jgi:16S rRNA (guanine527-N7)-methyltransferase